MPSLEPGVPEAAAIPAEAEIDVTEAMIERAADELWFFSGIDDRDGRQSAARAILPAAVGRPINHDA